MSAVGKAPSAITRGVRSTAGWPVPQGARYTALAYDIARGRAVLFGGDQTRDTWAPNGELMAPPPFQRDRATGESVSWE